MPTIPIDKLTETLSDLEKPRWIWIPDQELTVFGDKDHPPDFTPSGCWQYQPPMSELFADAAPIYNKLTKKRAKV
jgi:hypothetical protein